ncbi:hypothetical protein LOH54_09915 [Sulfurimonas sp. HSL-3221]|uniref:hypothetical protein n=1 Tax=Sulfurimonadaceae TaxID=2771471 RepID=UPI001E6294F6|nr:hypothetical protein [Sulfurimonas sp. HSL-3221]UFS61964.1 hypothetical protein LOH54_09915 [Sulfurimonas sp. HSL-3221]
MRPVMTVMGSLILAGNLLLAVPLRPNAVTVRNAEQSEHEVRKAVAEALVAKGLEAQSAQQIVAERFAPESGSFAVVYAHFRMLFPEYSSDAVLSEMARRVLHGERLTFDDYDQLVGMLHRLEGVALTPSHYERARHCALLNRYRSQA